jgi:hypothetical protein
MTSWRRVPWSLWIFAGLTLFDATLIEVEALGPIAAKVLFPVVVLVYLYFLLRGVRWLWIATIAVGILVLIVELISGSIEWQGVIWSLIDFMLLLLPVTRRYFSGHTAAAGLSA